MRLSPSRKAFLVWLTRSPRNRASQVFATLTIGGTRCAGNGETLPTRYLIAEEIGNGARWSGFWTPRRIDPQSQVRATGRHVNPYRHVSAFGLDSSRPLRDRRNGSVGHEPTCAAICT